MTFEIETRSILSSSQHHLKTQSLLKSDDSGKTDQPSQSESRRPPPRSLSELALLPSAVDGLNFLLPELDEGDLEIILDSLGFGGGGDRDSGVSNDPSDCRRGRGEKKQTLVDEIVSVSGFIRTKNLLWSDRESLGDCLDGLVDGSSRSGGERLE